MEGIAASNHVLQEDGGLFLDALATERFKHQVRECCRASHAIDANTMTQDMLIVLACAWSEPASRAWLDSGCCQMLARQFGNMQPYMASMHPWSHAVKLPRYPDVHVGSREF